MTKPTLENKNKVSCLQQRVLYVLTGDVNSNIISSERHVKIQRADASYSIDRSCGCGYDYSV